MLVKTDRPEALARGILKLALDSTHRSKLGAAAATRAGELDAAVWAPRLERLYADVIRVASSG